MHEVNHKPSADWNIWIEGPFVSQSSVSARVSLFLDEGIGGWNLKQIFSEEVMPLLFINCFSDKHVKLLTPDRLTQKGSSFYQVS